MNARLAISEIRQRLSWVNFLAPLSEDELDHLVRVASLVRLARGDELVVGNEEQAERMLIAVAGQLQVYEVALGSGRELTLSVLPSGSPVEGGYWPGAPLGARPAHKGPGALGGVPHRAPRPGGAGAP